MSKEYSDAVADQVGRNLRQFGYTNLTKEEVRDVCRKLVKDGAMTGGGIGMFAKKMLEENGYIEESE